MLGVVGGPASTFNPYLYVRGNPVNLTDPSGRIAPLVAAGLVVGAATISHVDQTVVLLTIDGETLTTTAEHPFYTISGEWVNAGDLKPGDEVVSLDGSGTVESIAVVVDPQPMYNLTVDEVHTFFVGDGDWLVHNTDNCDVFFHQDPSTEKQYIVATHNTEGLTNPRPQGMQSHHGVNSEWMQRNYPEYVHGRAPTVYLPVRDHRVMNGVFNTWRREMAAQYNEGFNWANITSVDVMDLAQRQFHAVSVPRTVVNEYWRQFAGEYGSWFGMIKD